MLSDHILCTWADPGKSCSLLLSLAPGKRWKAAREPDAMGLLKVGTPLHWKDSLEHCNYVRLHGIHQFVATYRRLRHLENDRLFYGEP